MEILKPTLNTLHDHGGIKLEINKRNLKHAQYHEVESILVNDKGIIRQIKKRTNLELNKIKTKLSKYIGDNESNLKRQI